MRTKSFAVSLRGNSTEAGGGALTCTDSPPTTQSRYPHGARSSSCPYPEHQQRRALPNQGHTFWSARLFIQKSRGELVSTLEPPQRVFGFAMALPGASGTVSAPRAGSGWCRETVHVFSENWEDAYLSAGKVVPSRQDLGPTIERAAGWEGLKLDVFSWFGHVSLAIAGSLGSLAASPASLGLVCVWCHVWLLCSRLGD